MKKFLKRDVLGFPVWVWFMLGLILCFYVNKLWLLFFGSVPAVVALQRASKEAQDKADKLIEDSQDLEHTFGEQMEANEVEGKRFAENSLSNSESKQDDTNDPFMD